MSDIKDIAVTGLPGALMNKIIRASAYGTCLIDSTNDGIDDKEVSSYAFLEDMAAHPNKYANPLATAGAAALAVGSEASLGVMLAIDLAAGPAGIAAAIGTIVAGVFLSKNRVATLLIANQTNGSMHLKEIYQDCGWQSGRPSFDEKDPDTGATLTTKPDLIPGREDLGGVTVSGLGVYRFEKDLSLGIGVYGTSGAISFSFDDPAVEHDMAICWNVPETGSSTHAATTNLGKYTSLQDFYDKTLDVSKPGYGEILFPTLVIARTTNAFNKANGLPPVAPDLPGGPLVLISHGDAGFPDTANENDVVFTASFFSERPPADPFK